MKKTFVIFVFKYLSLSMFLFSLSACGKADEKEYTRESINQTRLCPEIRYSCLAETKNIEWRQSLLINERMLFSRELLWMRLRVIEKMFAHYKVDKGIDAKGRGAFEQLRYRVVEDPKDDERYKELKDAGNSKRGDLALKIAAEFMNKTEGDLVSDKYYQMTEREERDSTLRKKQRWYTEIAEFVELLYPGFWGNTPKEEQIKWVMKVESIVRKFDPNASGRGGIEIMAGICGIVGTDFESNPIHKPITDYLLSISKSDVGQLSQTWDYLSFSYMERDYSFSGRRYSGWALRDALAHLPRPKREIPRLSELPADKMYHEPSDIWKVYEETIVDRGEK